MSTTQAEFRARLQSLADKFKANADEYLAASYAEVMAHHQPVAPLFGALSQDHRECWPRLFKP